MNAAVLGIVVFGILSFEAYAGDPVRDQLEGAYNQMRELEQVQSEMTKSLEELLKTYDGSSYAAYVDVFPLVHLSYCSYKIVDWGVAKEGEKAVSNAKKAAVSICEAKSGKTCFASEDLHFAMIDSKTCRVTARAYFR